MSQDTKEALQETRRHLRSAERELKLATKYAKEGGDGKLAERVRKLSESAGSEAGEMDRKLNDNG